MKITSETRYVSEDSLVSHPSHYKSEDDIECIDAIRAMLGHDGFIAFCRGSTFKYVWRLLGKNDPVQNAQKAQQFLSFAIAELEKQKK